MKIRLITLTLILVTICSVSVSAKDQWIKVKTPNFNLIGNAKEKEIRAVATKLEQFRATFRALFPKAKFNQTIETNVVVFKNKSSYKPFLPKRADGKADKWIAGYFQSGEDVNYITLSTAGAKEDIYGTIFHEYVHFLMNTNFGRSVVPPWFNEGLAEYYQTFSVAKNNLKVNLGIPQENHVLFLRRSKLIPLQDFFKIDNRSLHATGRTSRSIFYAQAWALIHYLTLTNQSNNLSKFLGEVMNDVEPEEAFQRTFGYDYKILEKNLRKYVRRSVFQYQTPSLKKPLVFDDQMTVTPLSESEANAYLGDLLYHTHEYNDAEIYLKKSLELDPKNSLANTAFGLVKMRQGRYEEAKSYLEKAVAFGQKNHYAYYNYAYVLSRESYDEFGFVSSFPEEKEKKMLAALEKAIRLNSSFTPSYALFAFIYQVNDKDMNVAVAFLKKALSLQPGNQQYALRIAQIYLRQKKYVEAEKLVKNLAETAVEADIRDGAKKLLSVIETIKTSQAQASNGRREREKNGYREPVLKRRSDLTKKQVEEIQQENVINRLHQEFGRPRSGEKQILGYVQKIECIEGAVKYSVKTEGGDLALKSKDFEELHLLALTEDAETLSVSCDADISRVKTVLTYRDENNAKIGSKGNLLSMVFVPKFFRLKTKKELEGARRIAIVEQPKRNEVPDSVREEMQNQRRELMMKSIKDRLRQPQTGEIRRVGFLQEVECKRKYQIFHVKVGEQVLKLKVGSPETLKIIGYTREMERVNLRCGSKPPPVNAVITYKTGKASKKINGEIVALEFVPKSFTLD